MLTCTEHDVIYSILASRFARIHFWFKYEAVNISNNCPLKTGTVRSIIFTIT